jgi:hypothetical protein
VLKNTAAGNFANRVDDFLNKSPWAGRGRAKAHRAPGRFYWQTRRIQCRIPSMHHLRTIVAVALAVTVLVAGLVAAMACDIGSGGLAEESHPSCLHVGDGADNPDTSPDGDQCLVHLCTCVHFFSPSGAHQIGIPAASSAQMHWPTQSLATAGTCFSIDHPPRLIS